MKYVIIGGVAGGATAAARMRRADDLPKSLCSRRENIYLMQTADCLTI